MKKYFDTFLLFGSLGLLVIWVDQFIYKGVDMKDCYFFLMFAIAGFLTYLFRRGQKKMDADKSKEEAPKKSMEARLKANYGKKKKKS
ncbi:hypothetical protein [uncultured Arcticibacterium sp.]|uniref:hypothetical protein n=1 Tax=uncultured Arcticibacterium sp. TaxID=2173042 RepID=UPI0030F893DA